MVIKGGRRREQDREKAARRSHSSGDESDESEGGENEDRPLTFVLPGDDTGNGGIDYNILDDESWQTLQGYCKVRQALLLSYRQKMVNDAYALFQGARKQGPEAQIRPSTSIRTLYILRTPHSPLSTRITSVRTR